MCGQYRHNGFHCCFRRLPANEHTQQCLHELKRLRRTRSAVRWRRSLTGRSRHRHRGRWRWRCRKRRWQTHRRRQTKRRLRRKFRQRLSCASKSLRRNVSCCKRCKATNQLTEHQSSLSLRVSLMKASLVSICFCSKASAESLMERSCVASNSAICAHFIAQLSSISFSVSWVV